jgi:surfeit locus 1 family protein
MANSASIPRLFPVVSVIEDLIQNEQFRRIFPPVAAVGLIALFVSLGSWQLERAAEKESLQSLFESDAPFSRLTADMQVTRFQNVETFGSYDGQRQVLIDNMFVNNRIGYYVITAFRYAADQPLLIVNRGWVARPAAGAADPDLSVGNAGRSIRGRVGALPRVGIRPGEPFKDAGSWPKKGVYPTLEDLSAELGQELLPFIVLLSPEDDDGYGRRWQPRDSGPRMHYGYAFQWFAMATAVLGLLLWRLRKRAQISRS